MAGDNMIKFLDAFKAINLDDKRLQLFHCWCKEAGLTRFHNCFTALKQWLDKNDVAAVYLLPTARDAEIAMSHLEADGALAPLVASSTNPEAKHVLVKSCQQWVGENLMGKSLAMRDLVIVVDLGIGTVSSYASAMAAALFTELQPRDQSPLRTFSIVVLQQIPLPNTIGNYLFDHAVVCHAVSRKGWQVVLYNARTGTVPVVSVEHRPPGCGFKNAGFDEVQMANSLAVLQEGFQQAEADGRANETYKAVVLMSRERFRRLVGAVSFAKARSFFIHDRTPARVVQAICEDEEPGLTVIGITTTEFCLMPRVKGLRSLIADSTAEVPDFDDAIGHSITRETDAAFMRGEHLFDIASGAAGLVSYRLWHHDTHRPEKPVLFPAHHTGEMYHLIIRLADICPGQSLQKVPCLILPDKFPELLERVRRLSLWGIVERTGAGVRLTDSKGRLVSDLARHESDIHSLILLAGAADPSLGFSAQARHLLVWLAAVIAHDPQCILANKQELSPGSAPGGLADIMAQKGGIWSALLGVEGFSRRNNAGVETQEPQAQTVEATEAQQVLDWVALWADKLSLPAVNTETSVTEGVQPREVAVVEQHLFSAFIYNVAMFNMDTLKLVDLLSDTDLCLSYDTLAELVTAGQRWGQPVFAVYTDLRGSTQGISPRNLTIVSQKAVFKEMVKIAPRPDAQPGTSPIDLAVLRFRTTTPVALEPAPAQPQIDLVEGEMEWGKTD